MYMYEHCTIPFCVQSFFNWILFWEAHNAEYNVVCKYMFHLKNHDYMESKKLVKRKKKASKPRTENYFEELNRPVTYILDDVKETVITENTYRAIPYKILKTYFLPKGWF